jgi:hypothetical protein
MFKRYKIRWVSDHFMVTTAWRANDIWSAIDAMIKDQHAEWGGEPTHLEIKMVGGTES